MPRSVMAVLGLASALGAGLTGLRADPVTRFGAFTLAPGESRTVYIGPPFGNVRLCNDVGSAGALEAVIGDHEPVTLAPGICNDRYNGDRIALRNLSSGAVTGIYHSSINRQLGRGGR